MRYAVITKISFLKKHRQLVFEALEKTDCTILSVVSLTDKRYEENPARYYWFTTGITEMYLKRILYHIPKVEIDFVT